MQGLQAEANPIVKSWHFKLLEKQVMTPQAEE